MKPSVTLSTFCTRPNLKKINNKTIETQIVTVTLQTHFGGHVRLNGKDNLRKTVKHHHRISISTPYTKVSPRRNSRGKERVNIRLLNGFGKTGQMNMSWFSLSHRAIRTEISEYWPPRSRKGEIVRPTFPSWKMLPETTWINTSLTQTTRSHKKRKQLLLRRHNNLKEHEQHKQQDEKIKRKDQVMCGRDLERSSFCKS